MIIYLFFGDAQHSLLNPICYCDGDAELPSWATAFILPWGSLRYTLSVHNSWREIEGTLQAVEIFPNTILMMDVQVWKVLLGVVTMKNNCITFCKQFTGMSEYCRWGADFNLLLEWHCRSKLGWSSLSNSSMVTPRKLMGGIMTKLFLLKC